MDDAAVGRDHRRYPTEDLIKSVLPCHSVDRYITKMIPLPEQKGDFCPPERSKAVLAMCIRRGDVWAVLAQAASRLIRNRVALRSSTKFTAGEGRTGRPGAAGTTAKWRGTWWAAGELTLRLRCAPYAKWISPARLVLSASARCAAVLRTTTPLTPFGLRPSCPRSHCPPN